MKAVFDAERDRDALQISYFEDAQRAYQKEGAARTRAAHKATAAKVLEKT